MFVPWQLQKMHGLLLLGLPAFALHGAPQVHCAISVTIHHRGLAVWERAVVVTLLRGNACPVQTVHRNPGGLQGLHQRLRILAHGPAILEADVLEETLVVFHGVVGARCGDERYIMRPRVCIREEPWRRHSSPLLGADCQRADQRNTIIIT